MHNEDEKEELKIHQMKPVDEEHHVRYEMNEKNYFLILIENLLLGDSTNRYDDMERVRQRQQKAYEEQALIQAEKQKAVRYFFTLFFKIFVFHLIRKLNL
jgi:hypothetical protein